MAASSPPNSGRHSISQEFQGQAQNAFARLWRRKRVAELLIVAAATGIMAPAFIWGFPSGADAARNYRWHTAFYEALRAGIWYPQWLSRTNYGMGSPVFIFYPPLSFYVEAAFRWVTNNDLLSLSLAGWLALAVSGITMYALARSVLSRGRALAASILYLLIPAHLVEYYQYCALAELWTFAWLPLLLYAAGRTAKTEDWRTVPLCALAYSLLVLTHVPVAFIATLILPLYVLLLTTSPRGLAKVLAGLALGAGVAAIFLVPVIFERQYIQTSALTALFDYHDFFVFEGLGRFFKSHLFSPDHPRSDFVASNDAIAAGLVLILIPASVALWHRWHSQRKYYSRPGWPEPPPGASGKHESPRPLIAIWIVTAVSLVMTTRISAPLWKVVPGLRLLPFPERWEVIVTVGACLLGAADSLTHQSRSGFAKAVEAILRDRVSTGLMSAAVLSISVALNLWLTVVAIQRSPHNSAIFHSASLYKHEEPFYDPVWWRKPADDANDSEPARPRAPGVYQREPVIVSTGRASVVEGSSTPQYQEYTAQAATQATVVFKTLYFPGWTSQVDGSPSAIGPSENGQIQLTIAPGAHSILLRFQDSKARAFGKWISAISLVGLLWLAWWTRRRPARSLLGADDDNAQSLPGP